jgi:hypothetical protein
MWMFYEADKGCLDVRVPGIVGVTIEVIITERKHE